MSEEEIPDPLVFTDSAAQKVRSLIEEEGNPELMLRVYITGGGCSGFQYGFTFDEEIICKWEKLPAVKKRANEVLERYEKSSQNLGNNLVITSRFILLHTLAHLVIRELESNVGYPAA